jgi:hypothetical protein
MLHVNTTFHSWFHDRLSRAGRPILVILSFLSLTGFILLLVLSWHLCLAVLSWQFFPGRPVLAVLPRQSCPASLVLPVLFCLSGLDCPLCLSCSACPVLHTFPVLPVLFYLSRSACRVLSVLLCLSCSACPVLTVRF